MGVFPVKLVGSSSASNEDRPREPRAPAVVWRKLRRLRRFLPMGERWVGFMGLKFEQ